jgi:hypothetical protein
LHRLPGSQPEFDATALSQPPAGAPAARIVLADDNADMRAYVQCMLEAAAIR